jgi:hypothetical protein
MEAISAIFGGVDMFVLRVVRGCWCEYDMQYSTRVQHGDRHMMMAMYGRNMTVLRF